MKEIMKLSLVPPADEMWPANAGGMFCPVCFSKVPASQRVEHTEWHQNLADMFLAMLGK